MTGEIMKEVGAILKEARMEKGYSLDDIQKMTKIQKKYLTALEEGNEESLPGNFYARAFIRQYAEKVGLDGDQLIEEYDTSIPQPDIKIESQTTGQSAEDSKKRVRGLETMIVENLPTLLIILLVIAVLAALFFAFMNGGDSESSLIQEEPGQTSVEISSHDQVQNSDEEEAETGEEDTEGNEDTNSAVALEYNEGTRYTYTITHSEAVPMDFVLGAEGEPAWVSVTADGQEIQQGTLQDGETFEVEIPENVSTIQVILGNSPSTTLSINGESVALEDNESSDRTQQLIFEVATDE